MAILKISAITVEKIKKNKFVKELPEFYELKSVIENGAWHKNDSTFNHTLTVLEELKKLLKSINKNIKLYFKRKVDENTREELLFLATLLHDIAKKEAFIKNGDITSCPNHEELGYKKAKNILSRFDLSAREKEIVLDVVKNHDVLHLLIDPKDINLNEKIQKFKKEYKRMFLELILLAMADTLGCQLKENLPDEFNFRIKFYKKIIKNY